MALPNVFGKIITARDVRNAVVNTIKLWQADYLAEVAEQSGRGRGDLPNFRSFVPKININKDLADQLPGCVVISPGMVSQPRSRAGKQDGHWQVGIGSLCSANDFVPTWELAELYGAAVRAIILQHPSLGGFSEGITLMSERMQPLRADSGRTLVASIVEIGVDVLGITSTNAGPTAPSTDPTQEPGDWPTVETVSASHYAYSESEV